MWDHRKGLEDLIKLRSMLDKDSYTFILVGLTDKQIKNLPDGIRGITRTESIDELRALYSIADVFVNPTIEDNYPTTNIESSCCGTPVVTYRTGGSPESVPMIQVVEKNDLSGVKMIIEKEKLVVENKEYFEKKEMIEKYSSLILRKN